MFRSDLEFTNIQDIATQEKLDQFSELLKSMNIDDPRLLEFFKDASYDDIIKK